MAPVTASFFSFSGCRMASSRPLMPPSLYPKTYAESIFNTVIRAAPAHEFLSHRIHQLKIPGLQIYWPHFLILVKI